MSPKFKHLLLDLDGTLLANRELALTLSFFSKVLIHLKKEQGKKYSRLNALRALRALFRDFSTASKETNAIRFSKSFAKELQISEKEAKKLIEAGVKEFFPNLKKYFSPVEGAKEFIDWAKSHYTLTLATNPVWPVEIIKLRVQWAGIDPKIFDWISHWELMRAVKPLPEYYQQILEEREFDAKDCLLIGDSVRKDLPATKIGISVFIVNPVSQFHAFPDRPKRPKAYGGSYSDLKNWLTSSS